MGGPRSRPQPQDPQTSEFFRNRLSGETSEGVDKRQRRREPRRQNPGAQPEPTGSARALILPPSLGPLEQGLGPGTPALVSHWGRTVPGHMGSAGAEAAKHMQAKQLQELQALRKGRLRVRLLEGKSRAEARRGAQATVFRASRHRPLQAVLTAAGL